MRIRVEKAKHNTHRYTILSQNALEILRDYFKKEFAYTTYKPNDWLFPGQNKHRSLFMSNRLKIRSLNLGIN